ncbi:MAG TPA: alpha/beta hydrolase [Gaiellaceae bacterium]|nr:alpha/beta hydrolase [Gaiellaceae bacterium]
MHVTASGTRLWFDVDGVARAPEGATMRTRPTVVLVHGGPGSYDHSYLKPDFARLTSIAQVVYLDLRGHGLSGWGKPSEWSHEACADDIRALCDALGIERPIVLGHSMGGWIVALYGARHPGHAGGLVLQSTMARYDLERLVEGFRRVAGEDVAAIARRSYGTSETVSADEGARCFAAFGPLVPDEAQLARRIQNPDVGARGAELMRELDITGQLGQIDVPTLVSVGELDPVTPVEASHEIVDGLQARVGQLDVIPGAGHFPWLDQPSLYWTILERFVADVDAQP